MNTKTVIDAVKARITNSTRTPQTSRCAVLRPFPELIDQTTDTLRRALIEDRPGRAGARAVSDALRVNLIVTIPAAAGRPGSFLAYATAGLSSNIMGLAGIAIAIGVLVERRHRRH